MHMPLLPLVGIAWHVQTDVLSSYEPYIPCNYRSYTITWLNCMLISFDEAK